MSEWFVEDHDRLGWDAKSSSKNWMGNEDFDGIVSKQ